MKKTFLLLALLTTMAHAQNNSMVVRPQMHAALNTYIKLIPLSSNELKFTDPSNESLIKEYLEKLTKTFSSVNHMKSLKTPLFSPSAQTIQYQLSESLIQFNKGYKNMARIRVNNTLGLCASCHTQLPKDKASSFSQGIKKINRQDFENEYTYADFLFLVRNYPESLKQFEVSIQKSLAEIEKLSKESPKGDFNFNSKPLHDAFKKTLQILVKVQQNTQAAQVFLTKYTKDSRLPAIIKSEALEWTNELSKISTNENLPKTDHEIDRFITQYLTPFEKAGLPENGFEMTLLYSSGVLSRYLIQNSESQKVPDILYWMGVSAHRLNLNLFYDLGETYLTHCIEQFPKNPHAKKCLKEFEDQIIFGYTGSSGTDIPKDKQQQIDQYKKMIK